jgi:hypothetical protein
MRRSGVLIAMPLALLVIAGDAAVAQTDLTRADRRVLRRQDDQECRRQAEHQNILGRNLAEFLRKCMAERQGERRTAEKKEAAEQRRIRRGIAAEEWGEIQKVRNQERREQLEQQAAKRAECNKQATEQKLRLRDRRAFVKKCAGM